MSTDLFQELLDKAYQSIENDDLSAAMETTKEILNTNSEHPYGLEIMGYLLLELNCLEEAKFCFSKSIANGNNENHTPYLYLGQLTSGEESVNYFLKAIEMMKAYLESKDDKSRLFKPTPLDASNGYVSLSEIYMTDLCDAEDAEEKCRQYITKAVEEDDTNPASWQALASLNLIMNDKENCKVNISKSLSLWLPVAKKIMSDANLADVDTIDNEIITTCDLSSELRSKCAEILFELNMFEDMRDVLDSVLIEDDEHMQAHYLMATMLEAQMNCADTNTDDTKEAIVTHANMAVHLADEEVEQEAIEKMKALIEKYDDEDCCHDEECESYDDDDDSDDDME